MPRQTLPTLALCLTAASAFWFVGSSARDDTSAGASAPHSGSAGLDPSEGPVPAANLRAPVGFEVTVYANDDLVHDASCMTLDAQGRVAVSAPGYVRVLLDHDADGRADEAVPFAAGPKTGAQGLCFDGNDLLAVGDAGLIRYRDEDGDLRADGPPATLLKLKTGGEHHAHAIRSGPDGGWYLMCGNDTGITAADVTDSTSPVLEPEAGVLLRFDLDREAPTVSNVAVVADGLRNAYDFDFTATGDPVTYDSDDEREVSLPWYRPTRVFRLLPGSHAGWFSKSWKRPDAYPEMPEVLASLGRGSPTGVEVYWHTAFPEPYRGAVFVADWTFGRVVAIPLDGSDRPGDPIEFLVGNGAEGFAPTDVAVAPDGSLYVTAGGRGTNGRVYRVRYVGDGEANVAVGTSEWRDSENRAARHGVSGHLVKPDAESLVSALADSNPSLRKAAMHLVHRLPRKEQDDLRRTGESAGPAAAIRFHLGRLRRNREVDIAGLEVAVATLESKGLTPDLRYDAVRLAQLALGDVGPAPTTPDTFSGYTSRADLAEWQTRIDPVRSRVAALFPTDDAAADEELVRLLAMLRPDDPRLPGRLVARVTSDSHPTDDLHHLFALARLPAARPDDITRRTADALIALDAKLAARRLNRDTNWDERLSDLFAALTEADPGLAASTVRHPDFGRPGHVAFLGKASRKLRPEAAASLLRAATLTPDYPWSPEAVALLGTSDRPEVRARLRELYDDPTVRGAVLSALAERPEEADRAKFVGGLAEPQIDVIERCLTALEHLAPSGSAEETAALVTALERLDRDPREYAARDRVARLLTRHIDGDLGFVSGPAGHRPQPEAIGRWVAYARSVAPGAARPSPGDEWQSVRPLLAAAEALTGDPARGRTFYEAKACNRCHDGGSVGPDLAGVAGRFSRDDLFLAIADPDRDVSPRYRGTLIETADGEVISGLVVYESADGVMLKDGQKTSRIDAADIASRRPLDVSLMPRGLLRDFKPQDLADLEAYLRTLGR